MRARSAENGNGTPSRPVRKSNREWPDGGRLGPGSCGSTAHSGVPWPRTPVATRRAARTAVQRLTPSSVAQCPRDLLSTGPAVFVALSRAREFGLAALRRLRAVEREVEEEDLGHIGAAEI